MSVERVTRKHGVAYRVRWREDGRNRARTFDRKGDADRWDTEVRRRRQLKVVLPEAIKLLKMAA